MKYYHGTVAAYLPSIQKYGLQPKPEHQYKAWGYNVFFGRTSPMPIEHGVYVVDKKLWATKFAIYKTAWLGSADTGLVVTGDKPDDSTFHLYKAEKTKPIHTSPVVLTLELPETIVKALHEDERIFRWYAGSIPASTIIDIIYPKMIPFQVIAKRRRNTRPSR